MDVYWRQQGERIDPGTGKRIPVTDFRGQKITFPDYQATFRHLKDTMGLTQAERELAIIEAEKRGQHSLNESLSQRDAALKVLDPTGSPPDGPGLSETEALEILGVNQSNRTIDEEKMELLLREGNKQGWAMFTAVNKAREKMGWPPIEAEPHWRQSA
ncbi:MAG: hypothetical protein P8X74_23185 [Reinekea sp.]